MIAITYQFNNTLHIASSSTLGGSSRVSPYTYISWAASRLLANYTLKVEEHNAYIISYFLLTQDSTSFNLMPAQKLAVYIVTI